MNESTSIGNGEEKSVSDLPQVIDDSNQTVFENEGDSGNDSTSSAKADEQIQATNNGSSEKILSPNVVSNVTEFASLPGKSMFIKEEYPHFLR